MRYLSVILPALMLLLTGCAANITLHPITNQDFAYIKKGEMSPIDGYVMSEFYLQEVLKTKIETK